MRSPKSSRAITAPLAAAAAAALLASAPAHGQAINIDFGDVATLPPPSYAAAGWPGVWNAIGVLPPGQRVPLVGLDGAPIAAQIYGIGGTVMLVSDDPATSGDDEKLIDDMFIGYNAPVDLCLWLENMVDGEYEITTYAITPSNAALLSPVRVDFGTPGPTNVGGAWAGAHAEGLSYVKHVVTTVNGKIGLHSGTYGAGGQAGVNALQVRPMFPVGVGGPGSFESTRLLSAWPNPTRGDVQQISYQLVIPDEPVDRLEIVDVTGRVVWRHKQEPVRDPVVTLTVVWPGTDDAGLRVRPGVYFARLVGGTGSGDRTIGSALRLVQLTGPSVRSSRFGW